MVNYNLVNDRNNGLLKLPRLNFVQPNPQDNRGQANVAEYINFCQSGCQLEFKFNNIKSCSLNNDGAFFSITPTKDDKTNFVLWNGTDVNGLELTPFYLKEIYFSLPSKDRINVENINQSIQYYFSFVNESFSNLMICVSVIGQANNIGTGQKTNGFVLMELLADKIPLSPGQQVNLDNLNQFNLGSFLPDNKSFFTTLIADNNMQYILLTKVVDVPLIFFNNLVARVIGSRSKYDKKDLDFKDNPPTNPFGTIIFYNENIKPVGIDEAIVCDTNCNQVPGAKDLLTPEVGSGTTVRSERKVVDERGRETKDGKVVRDEKGRIKGEECVGEEVEPGMGPVDVRMEKQRKKEEIRGQVDSAFFVTMAVCGMIILILFILWLFHKLFGLHRQEGIWIAKVFSNKFWNKENGIPWLILCVFSIVNILATFIAGIILGDKAMREKEKDTPDESVLNNGYWISFVVGCSVYAIIVIAICIVLWKKSKNSGNFGPTTTYTRNYLGPERTSNIQLGNTNQAKLAQAVNILKSNPSYLQTDEGKRLYDNASKIYNSLPSNQKSKLQDIFGPSARKNIRDGIAPADISGVSFEASPRLINAIKHLSDTFPDNPYVIKLKPIINRPSKILTPSEIQSLVELQASKLN